MGEQEGRATAHRRMDHDGQVAWWVRAQAAREGVAVDQQEGVGDLLEVVGGGQYQDVGVNAAASGSLSSAYWLVV